MSVTRIQSVTTLEVSPTVAVNTLVYRQGRVKDTPINVSPDVLNEFLKVLDPHRLSDLELEFFLDRGETKGTLWTLVRVLGYLGASHSEVRGGPSRTSTVHETGRGNGH